MPSAQIASSDYIPRTVLPWAQILDDLRAADLRLSTIAELVGIERSTLQHYTKGHEPRESVGRALLEAHERYCGPGLTAQRRAEAVLVDP